MKLSSPNFKLSFFGGANTVTGSKTLVETSSQKTLIDCGLFQGIKKLRNLNRLSLKTPSDSIDNIILTHAHLDHCGYIPVLVKEGFKGAIHCTPATAELTAIILKDSAKIQEEDAERANKYSYTKHQTATPLYTIENVKMALDLIVTHEYNEWVILDNSIKFKLSNSGHIIGSSIIEMIVENKKIVFSGDLGRTAPMLLYPPKKIHEADYVVLESTYGDRIHAIEDVKVELNNIIQETFKKGGILMIPSFAVERTQEILYLIYQLRKEESLPQMRVYLDSPMGINATNVYDSYHEQQNISNFEINRIYDDVYFINDSAQSKTICLDNKPKIVIAGSGMIEGGRIIHYLNNHASNSKNTILFVGYQGEGTRGRAILNGSKEIKFFGEFHSINCDIRSISSLSAHADQSELISWLKHIKSPSKVFLNHGEAHQSDALRVKIEHELGYKCFIPNLDDEYLLP